MPTLHLSEELLDDMKARCARAYPLEACGLLLGRLVPREGKGPKLLAESLHAARNVESHGARFTVHPEDFVAADAAARDAGLEIVGVYHSHPGAPAEPSEADHAGAQPGWFHAIVAVEAGRAGDCRGYVLHDGRLREERICASC